MIRLTLPYPLSANRYWQSFVPRGASRALVHLSQEAKVYKRDVGVLARAAGVRQAIDGRVAVHIELYPHRPQDWRTRQRKDPIAWDDTVQCIDLDNARKVLYDALKGIAFVDDGRIFRDSAERMLPDEHGARVVVTVTPIVLQAHPQQSLMEAA